uniref:Protein PRRC1 n=1 Tax=Syphacia muris TaxID=451379 RepID=A0A0N5AU56_9BILA
MDNQVPRNLDLPLTDTIAPPKDLPKFITSPAPHPLPNKDKLPPIEQPLLSQVNSLPQPQIIVAPPTPCPLVSPTASIEPQFPLPGSITYQATSQSASSSNAEGSMNKATSESKGQAQKSENAEEVGVLGWLQKHVNNSAFLSKVADKAKTSMDSVLTTLDPGMKDFLKKEGTINIVIASENIRIVNAIADGFRKIFATVNHQSIAVPVSQNNYPEIVGYSTALKCIKDRITLLRASGSVAAKSAVIVFQPFLHEIEDDWYESAVIGAQKNTSITHVFSQPIQVDASVMSTLQKHTPQDYNANAYAITVGEAYAEVYGTDSDDWQLARWSVSSTEIYRRASTILAHSFKEKYSIP